MLMTMPVKQPEYGKHKGPKQGAQTAE